jgi:hypothetical protein
LKESGEFVCQRVGRTFSYFRRHHGDSFAVLGGFFPTRKLERAVEGRESWWQLGGGGGDTVVGSWWIVVLKEDRE